MRAWSRCATKSRHVCRPEPATVRRPTGRMPSAEVPAVGDGEGLLEQWGPGIPIGVEREGVRFDRRDRVALGGFDGGHVLRAELSAGLRPLEFVLVFER